MSVPRKIWVAVSPRGDLSCDSQGGKLNGVDRHALYHHDDVVRELVNLIADMKQRLDYCGDLFQDQGLDGREASCRKLAARADVTLAKIAQDA